MYKRILLLILSVQLVGVTALQAARGPQNVSNSPHNMSSTRVNDPVYSDDYYISSNEDEVCVFCHTPHGGLARPGLWNRDLPTQTFTHYTSATADTFLQTNVNRAVSDESLICLSCHDGITSPSAVINPNNGTGGLPELNGGTASPLVYVFGGPNALIGAEMLPGDPFSIDPATRGSAMNDDHPISFDYDAIESTKPTKFQLSSFAEGRGIRFFDNSYGTKSVECSTCHDPHVDYWANSSYTPFLVTSNSASYICLSCHKK